MPEIYDETRFFIRVAKRFNCTLAEAYEYPPVALTVANVEMEVEEIYHERAEAEREKIRRKANATKSQQTRTRRR